MEDIDKAILEFTIFFFFTIICCCCCCRCRCNGSVELPPDQTPETQQDIETGLIKGLLFKDIKEKDDEQEEACGKRCCPICLEEYEDDHETSRLEKCRHVFHRV